MGMWLALKACQPVADINNSMLFFWTKTNSSENDYLACRKQKLIPVS